MEILGEGIKEAPEVAAHGADGVDQRLAHRLHAYAEVEDYGYRGLAHILFSGQMKELLGLIGKKGLDVGLYGDATL